MIRNHKVLPGRRLVTQRDDDIPDLLAICVEAKSSKTVLPRLIGVLDHGLKQAYGFSDKAVETAICRLQDHGEFNDMYKFLLLAIKQGVRFNTSTVERCFCVLRNNDMLQEAITLLRTIDPEEYRFKDKTVTYTAHKLLDQGKNQEAQDFIEVAFSKGYPIEEDVCKRMAGANGDANPGIATLISTIRMSTLGQLSIREKLTEAVGLVSDLLADMHALLEKDPKEASLFLQEAIQISKGSINFKLVVGETVTKLLSIGCTDEASELVLTALYAGVEVDKEIILQAKLALETGGKNDKAVKLSRFCE